MSSCSRTTSAETSQRHLTHAGGAISGNVIDLKDGPVRNFKIRVMIPRDYKGGEQVGGYYAGYDWYGISYTNRDGLFNLSGLRARR